MYHGAKSTDIQVQLCNTPLAFRQFVIRTFDIWLADAAFLRMVIDQAADLGSKF